MTKLLIVAAKKGGSTKSTTATNQAASFALKGFKTLLIDLDPQGHVLLYYGIDPKKYEPKTLTDIIKDPKLNYEKCLVDKRYFTKRSKPIDLKDIENLDILPTNFLMQYAIDQDREAYKKLAVLINNIKKSNKYDYIVVDTNPAWTILTAALFRICNVWVVPFEPTAGCKDAVDDILVSFKDGINPNMKLIIVPSKATLRMKKNKETGLKEPLQNVDYLYIQAVKNATKGLKNAYVAEPLAKSAQYENAVSFEHRPAVLIRDKIIGKPYNKIKRQQNELNKFILSLFGDLDQTSKQPEFTKSQPKPEVKVEEPKKVVKQPKKTVSTKKVTKKRVK